MAIHPDDRAAILADIQTGELGRNAIARKHRVSAGTVTAIAQHEGVDDAFDRSATKRATEAQTADLAAWRVDFAQKIAARAQWLEARMDEPQESVIVTRDGPEHVFTELSGREAQAYMTAVGIAVDKVGVLTRDDTQGVAAVDAWLRTLLGTETTA